MSLIPVRDTEIFVERHGAGAPLLLVAGLGGRAAFWAKQIPAFAPHFEVILHDHRGTGRSRRDEIAYSVEQMARDVLGLMDALGIEKTRLVGHSTGGAIGQWLAVHAPERLGRLVISASWAGPDPFFQALFRLRKQVLETMGAATYLAEGTLLAAPGWWLQQNYAAQAAQQADRLRDFPGLPIELARIEAVMQHDLRAKLGGIRTPTLVIRAKDDLITPTALSAEIAAAVPGALSVELPSGGHFCPQIVPAPFNAAVLDFLTKE